MEADEMRAEKMVPLKNDELKWLMRLWCSKLRLCWSILCGHTVVYKAMIVGCIVVSKMQPTQVVKCYIQAPNNVGEGFITVDKEEMN